MGAYERHQLLRGQERTNYPLILSVDDRAEAIQLFAQTDLPKSMRSVPLSYVQQSMESMLEALRRGYGLVRFRRFRSIPEAERCEVESSASTRRNESTERRIGYRRCLKRQVERTPDAVAVEYEQEQLTYAQLNARANRLAHALRARGVGADDLVGLCVNRSVDLVVAVLGIVKSGASYLPLDTEYPAERLAYMVEDAAPKVLLTQPALRELLQEEPGREDNPVVEGFKRCERGVCDLHLWLERPAEGHGDAACGDGEPDPVAPGGVWGGKRSGAAVCGREF